MFPKSLCLIVKINFIKYFNGFVSVTADFSLITLILFENTFLDSVLSTTETLYDC